MRIDAQRNRDQILEVARRLFATDGVSVSVDAIARAAGVGVGTVHRHFPTKSALIESVIVSSAGPLLEALDDALAGEDPGAGLEAFLLTVVEYQSEHRALAEEMRNLHDGSPAFQALKTEIGERLARLVSRAQADGQIRSDVGPGDLRLLMAVLAQTATAAGTVISPDDKVRFLRIMLDGMRTPTPSALPGDAPGL